MNNWNELTLNQRLIISQQLNLYEKDLNDYVNNNKKMLVRLKQYYFSVLERLSNAEIYPDLSDCDIRKEKRLPRYDKDSQELLGSTLSILTLVAHCYPAKKRKAERQTWSVKPRNL